MGINVDLKYRPIYLDGLYVLILIDLYLHQAEYIYYLHIQVAPDFTSRGSELRTIQELCHFLSKEQGAFKPESPK